MQFLITYLYMNESSSYNCVTMFFVY